VYALNPVSGVLDLGRWALVRGPWPGLPLAISATVALALAAAGLAYFRRASRSFADVI
jgi:ABC-2 type transport system permease protein